MRGCQRSVCPARGIERPTTIEKDTTTASAEDGRSKRWLDTAAMVAMVADVMNTTAADMPAVESTGAAETTNEAAETATTNSACLPWPSHSDGLFSF